MARLLATLVSSVAPLAALCCPMTMAVPPTHPERGDCRDCISACKASGCGANVGGGCYHICSDLRDPSPENVSRVAAEFREIAAERTLDAITRSSSIIGIARVTRIVDARRYRFSAELEFLERWKSDGSEHVFLDGSYQECDSSWALVRENQLGLFFLQPAAGGKYRIAGRGWGRFEVSGTSPGALATGGPPPPLPVKVTFPEPLRRSNGWRAALGDLRAYVDSATVAPSPRSNPLRDRPRGTLEVIHREVRP